MLFKIAKKTWNKVETLFYTNADIVSLNDGLHVISEDQVFDTLIQYRGGEQKLIVNVESQAVSSTVSRIRKS